MDEVRFVSTARTDSPTGHRGGPVHCVLHFLGSHRQGVRASGGRFVDLGDARGIWGRGAEAERRRQQIRRAAKRVILPFAMFVVMSSFLTLLVTDRSAADEVAVFYACIGVGLTGFNLWREWRHGRRSGCP